jgi:hypothetical protein
MQIGSETKVGLSSNEHELACVCNKTLTKDRNLTHKTEM